MKQVKSLFRRISVVVLFVFLMVNCSFSVLALDNQENSFTKDGRYSDSELEEQSTIYQEIVSSDFIELMYTHISAGFSPNCSVENLFDSKYGQAFKIPNYEVDNGVVLTTEIWYVPVLNNGKMVLLNEFFFIDGELHYVISSGYTDTFNSENFPSAKWVFDEEGTLRACSPQDSLYENLPYLNPFEDNETIDATIGDLYSSDLRSVVTTSTHVYLSSYPLRMQPGSSTCWAATIASIVAYERPSIYGSITAADVCYAVNVYGSGNSTVVINALSNYLTYPYYSPTYLTYCLSFSAMQNTIGNDDPVFIFALSSDNTKGHAVALMGYYINGNQRALNIMNPNTSCIETGSYSAYTPLYFTSSNIAYRWDRTAKIK